jgi:hypothetical protein
MYEIESLHTYSACHGSAFNTSTIPSKNLLREKSTINNAKNYALRSNYEKSRAILRYGKSLVIDLY